MKEKTPVSDEKTSRRKVLVGIGLFSLLSIWAGGLFSKKRGLIACAPPEKKQTMKVLTQDGQLVEVELSRIKKVQEKISDKDLQEWVKKK